MRRPGLGPALHGRRHPHRAALVRLPGYRGETDRSARASDDEACASPCCAPPRHPRPCSRRNPHASGERSPQARAGPWHRFEGGRRGAGVRPDDLDVPRSRSPRAASAGSRWAARCHDLTGIRRTDGRDPCCGGTRGSRGRHGCAYAAGSRGSSRDDGCSAGRCACSLGGSSKNRWWRGAVLAVTVRPRVARVTPQCTAFRSPDAICAHRRQAAAAIDNSTWLRYAGARHPVKPVTRGRHYPQAGDNNLNRTRRPDYRG